ncbi:MAG: alpha/beta hydrolase [Candidatus Saccharimonadales bacterium]
MKLELIQLLSTDNLKLPGLLYTPEKRTKKAAIWLHGMGDNGMFYNPKRINALGQAMTDEGITFLSFNNRGAHDKKTLSVADSEDKYQAGTHYELIADCVKDIDGAVQFLKDKKYNELYLVGHSTGANKICVYNQTAAKNPFSKFVLAGPGDDSGLFYTELGKDLFNKALSLSKTRTQQGDGLSIMHEKSGMNPFSAQSTYDILNPNGAYNSFPFYENATERLGTKVLFKEYRQIRIPTLVVYGEEDEYAYTAGSVSDALIALEENTHSSVINSCAFLTIPDTDHGFHGAEDKFAKSIASWLTRGY